MRQTLLVALLFPLLVSCVPPAQGISAYITNKGDTNDYPSVAYINEDYSITVRWYQDFQSSRTEITVMYGPSTGGEYAEGLVPGSYARTFTTKAWTDWAFYVFLVACPQVGGACPEDTYTHYPTLVNPFELVLSVSPEFQSVRQGSSVEYNIAVNLVRGASDEASLSMEGNLPPQIDHKFSVLNGRVPFTSRLTITAASDAGPGSYVVTIAVSGLGKSYRKAVTLQVEGVTVSSAQTDGQRQETFTQATTQQERLTFTSVETQRGEGGGIRVSFVEINLVSVGGISVISIVLVYALLHRSRKRY